MVRFRVFCRLIFLAWIFKTSTSITTNLDGVIKISDGNAVSKTAVENSLMTIHNLETENLGTVCISRLYLPLEIPLNSDRYESSRQKCDLAANVLQDVGVAKHGGLLDALAKGLLSDENVINTRILSLNTSNGAIQSYVWWTKNEKSADFSRYEEDGLEVGKAPDPSYPWFEDEISSPGLRSPKFISSPPNFYYKGWWTYPYYSCVLAKWILSYSVAVPPMGRHGSRGFLSIDIDISNLRVNQCDAPITRYNYYNIRPKRLLIHEMETAETSNDIEAFHGSHKCHWTMSCDYRLPFEQPTITNNIRKITTSWHRGAYQCHCKKGYYSTTNPEGYNGTIMEVAWKEYQDNISDYYVNAFKCAQCAPGCGSCKGPEPCLASYNWPFRISLLTISVGCAISTFMLACYLFKHRKCKVFKVASPIFLLITLIGCAMMYMEMAAIFPILDTYWCIATKWTRHMGFCITYTSLLMKTWRVSLTYRVKSAHKVKLTDKQLLQWMVPILLVMLIYLGTWTISATPYAEIIYDQDRLKFKQCSYNWWDHSLALGEVLFLAWGIRVCYNVRNAESLYNEARLISYAIYNIGIVNTAMMAFHVFLFPHAGPDIKYLLGFVRTQLSTTTTIVLVFGPKVSRVWKGQGDQWDSKSRVRSITASFSLNGVGLVPEDSPDLYQENEELKEEIQKLAHQIEFMKTVHMQLNNRHLKPKPGGYFTITSTSFSPFSKTFGFGEKTAQTQTSKQNSTVISEDGHSGTNSVGANSIGYPMAPNPTPQKSRTNEKV